MGIRIKCPVCHEVNCWYLKFLTFMTAVGSGFIVLAVILK